MPAVQAISLPPLRSAPGPLLDQINTAPSAFTPLTLATSSATSGSAAAGHLPFEHEQRAAAVATRGPLPPLALEQSSRSAGQSLLDMPPTLAPAPPRKNSKTHLPSAAPPPCCSATRTFSNTVHVRERPGAALVGAGAGARRRARRDSQPSPPGQRRTGTVCPRRTDRAPFGSEVSEMSPNMLVLPRRRSAPKHPDPCAWPYV